MFSYITKRQRKKNGLIDLLIFCARTNLLVHFFFLLPSDNFCLSIGRRFFARQQICAICKNIIRFVVRNSVAHCNLKSCGVILFEKQKLFGSIPFFVPMYNWVHDLHDAHQIMYYVCLSLQQKKK